MRSGPLAHGFFDHCDLSSEMPRSLNLSMLSETAVANMRAALGLGVESNSMARRAVTVIFNPVEFSHRQLMIGKRWCGHRFESPGQVFAR